MKNHELLQNLSSSFVLKPSTQKSFLSRFLIGALVTGSLLGCTRSEEASTRVSIQTPEFFEGAEPPRRLQSSVAYDVDGSGEGESSWSGSINSRSEINCYMLFVGGPSANLKGNYCNARNSSVRVADFGPLVGGVPAGQKLEIDLPSGRDRVFYLLGMKSNQGSCKSFMPNGPDQKQITYPRLLSKVSVNLQGSTQTVPMSVPLDLSNLTEIDKCEVKSIGGGGQYLENLTQYFGDRRDGDVSFNAEASGFLINGASIELSNGTHTPFSGSPISGSKKFAAARKITDIGPLGTSLTLDSTFVAADFEAGDEVLVHVTASHGPGVSGTGPDGGCGSQDLYAGAFRFRRILSVGTDNMTLDQPVSSTPGSINRSLLNVTSSPRGGNSGTNFCSMQVVRVPSIQNFSITGGNTVTAELGSAFNTGSGGILALRIRNLTLQPASSELVIDASSSGFSKGTTVGSGVGFGGILNSLSSVGITNAGAAVNASLAAGGAGFGHGGIAVAYPDSGGRAPDYCSTGSKCELFRHQKAILGGGGGSATASMGGDGGGILLLFIEQITGNGRLTLKSNGGTSTAHGGGGGGGRVLLITRKFQLPTNKLSIEAKGGGSQSNNGVGGGGEIEVRTCLSQSNPINTANLLVPLGTGGSLINAQMGRAEVVHVPQYCF